MPRRTDVTVHECTRQGITITDITDVVATTRSITATADGGNPVLDFYSDDRTIGDYDTTGFVVYEEGNDESLSYSWAAPDSTNVGMNLRWFQAGCTAE